MKQFRDFIAEAISQEALQRVNVFIDADASKWDGVRDVASYMASRGYGKDKLVGVALTKAGWKGGKISDMALYEPDSFDAGLLKSSGVKVKAGEVVFRMATKSMAAGGIMSFLKVNIQKGIAYFMVDNEDPDDETIAFETKGEKLQYGRFTAAFAKRHINYV